MASSTAETTICGSIPFSRLKASMTLYSSLGIGIHLPQTTVQMLELRNQLRLFHIGIGNLQYAGALLLHLLLAGYRSQIHRQLAAVKLNQPPLKVAVPIDRLVRAEFHQATLETLEVRGFEQLPVKTRRRDF